MQGPSLESIYEASGLRRVVNACVHMTSLSVSIISDEVAEECKLIAFGKRGERKRGR